MNKTPDPQEHRPRISCKHATMYKDQGALVCGVDKDKHIRVSISGTCGKFERWKGND